MAGQRHRQANKWELAEVDLLVVTALEQVGIRGVGDVERHGGRIVECTVNRGVEAVAFPKVCLEISPPKLLSPVGQRRGPQKKFTKQI